jgi:hypothetical protein
VFRFYKDGSYLYALVKRRADEAPFTLEGLKVVTKWLAKESFPGKTPSAGQATGTFQTFGKTVTLTRVPFWGDRMIEYSGTLGTNSITFKTLDHNTGQRRTETFTCFA